MSLVVSRVRIVSGDITDLDVDTIVNAANSTLLGGGGVDGAIHRAAGPGLLAECRSLGGCPTGQARITKGYRLPTKHLIHTVGPKYRDGKHGEPELLRACYLNSLKLAVEHGVRTITFPAISCGIYGYPLKEAAQIALSAVAEFLSSHPLVERTVFVLYDDRAFSIYEETLRRMSLDAAAVRPLRR